MNEKALEIKVGLVLIAAGVVLAGFLFLLGDFGFASGIKVTAEFAFSGAIQEGAPVKISGIRVGRVSNLVFVTGKVDDKGEPITVQLELIIEERAKPVLKKNTLFYVSTQSLLGENYVEIVPQSGDAPPLEDGAVVRGEDPARFDLLFARLYDVLDGLAGVMRDNREVFVDLMRSAASLAGTLDTTLKANQGDLAAAIKNAAIATDEAAKTLASVRKIIGNGEQLSGAAADVAATTALLKKELPVTLEKVSRALDEVNRLAGTLEGVDKSKVDLAMTNALGAIEKANSVLGDVKLVSERVRGGQGTIGLLVQDEEIYDDLKEMLRDLKTHPWKLIWRD